MKIKQRVNHSIDWYTYENKLFHKLIHHQDGNWQWLQFACRTYAEICDKIKDADYYVKPEDLRNFMVNNANKISNIVRFGEKVPLSDVMMIRNANGYFLAIQGHFKPINLKTFEYKIE